MTKELIAIGSDHAAYELKEQLKVFLESKGYEVKDFGCDSPESIDYPAIGAELSKFIASEPQRRGLLMCGSGIGMSITANRIKGVRAALCHNVEFAQLSRQHNNSNVLVLAGRFTAEKDAKDILEAWLNTEFEGGRHQRRLDMIENLD